MNASSLLLAYKYVVLILVNAEADLAIARLESETVNPFSFFELKRAHVASPTSFQGGALEDARLHFGYTESSRHISTYDANGRGYAEMARSWALLPSKVDTNGAIALANQWLRAIDVNVDELNRTHSMKVRQRYFVEGTKRQMLPLYEMEWEAAPGYSIIQVCVFGFNKSPFYIRQDNAKFSRRPKHLVKSPEQLLAIPDDTFLKMPDIERQKLVLAHASTNYSNLRFPPRDWFERRFASPPATASPPPFKKPANVITIPPKKPDKAP